MSDIFVLRDVTAICQDGVTREGGSVVVRNDQYVFLDADGETLQGERRVTEISYCIAPMDPMGLSMVTSEYGPILT